MCSMTRVAKMLAIAAEKASHLADLEGMALCPPRLDNRPGMAELFDLVVSVVDVLCNAPFVASLAESPSTIPFNV